jgi:hypothetical protein
MDFGQYAYGLSFHTCGNVIDQAASSGIAAEQAADFVLRSRVPEA